jgi:hypothetical protein
MDTLATSRMFTSRLQNTGNNALTNRSKAGTAMQPKAPGRMKEFFAVLLRSLGTLAV